MPVVWRHASEEVEVIGMRSDKALLILAINELKVFVTAKGERHDKGIDDPLPVCSQILRESGFAIIDLHLRPGRDFNAACRRVPYERRVIFPGITLGAAVADLPRQVVLRYNARQEPGRDHRRYCS